MLGQTIGPYELLEEVGRGGMAAVYRARQPNMNRFVAIKIIFRSFGADTKALERFKREAELIARLEHPHILPVYDYNGDNDPPYIVMRFLPTGTLRDVMVREQIPPSEIAFLLSQVASALDYAHRQGIVHRDIKPSNILIDGDGNAFLTDFGIARMVESSAGLTATGIAVGTPGYMAPEQGMGNNVDSRADVYALGVMVFEMLTGVMPYNGETPMAVVLKHISEPVPDITKVNPALSPAVNAVIQKVLAKQPENRYATTGEFSRAFTQAIGDTSSSPNKLQEAAARTIVELQAARAAQPPRAAKPPTGTAPVNATSAPVGAPATSVLPPAPVTSTQTQAAARGAAIGAGLVLAIMAVLGVIAFFIFSTVSSNNQNATFTAVALANQNSTGTQIAITAATGQAVAIIGTFNGAFTQTQAARPTATITPSFTAIPPTFTFTSVPPTSAPTVVAIVPTAVPPSVIPPTAIPSTSIPVTAVPPTAVPPTSAALVVPPTAVPVTAVPPTSMPSTAIPPTVVALFAPTSIPAFTATPIPPSVTAIPASLVPPTRTFTAIPPSLIPPTATRIPPSATAIPPTRTFTAIPPTHTFTAVPPTLTPTFTAIPPTATPTFTPVPPTSTPTLTPSITLTPTNTPITPTLTPFIITATPLPGPNIIPVTSTPVPVTATPLPGVLPFISDYEANDSLNLYDFDSSVWKLLPDSGNTSLVGSGGLQKPLIVLGKGQPDWRDPNNRTLLLTASTELDSDSAIGRIVFKQSSTGYYVFEFASGYVRVSRGTGATIQTTGERDLTGGRIGSAPVRSKQFYKWLIWSDDSRVYVYQDNKLIVQARDTGDPLPGGNISLLARNAGASNAVRFDNLKVQRPAAASQHFGTPDFPASWTRTNNTDASIGGNDQTRYIEIVNGSAAPQVGSLTNFLLACRLYNQEGGFELRLREGPEGAYLMRFDGGNMTLFLVTSAGKEQPIQVFTNFYNRGFFQEFTFEFVEDRITILTSRVNFSQEIKGGPRSGSIRFSVTRPKDGVRITDFLVAETARSASEIAAWAFDKIQAVENRTPAQLLTEYYDFFVDKFAKKDWWEGGVNAAGEPKFDRNAPREHQQYLEMTYSDAAPSRVFRFVPGDFLIFGAGQDKQRFLDSSDIYLRVNVRLDAPGTGYIQVRTAKLPLGGQNGYQLALVRTQDDSYTVVASEITSTGEVREIYRGAAPVTVGADLNYVTLLIVTYQDKVAYFANGKLLAAQENIAILGGTVALGVERDSVARFDNFQLRDVSPEVR